MTQTVQAIMMAGTAQLREAGLDSPARETQLLMARAIGVAADRMILHTHDAITPSQIKTFDDGLIARQSRIPMSHILGGRMFYDRWFTVTSDVLDPRPETEVLIAQALEGPFERVLDLGTGSGAIVTTLLAERRAARGVGTDISEAALDVARQNAIDLGIVDNLRLLLSDWYGAISERFDLIVSNPPYIAADEMIDLQPEVRNHEPRLALTDEADGLSCYRRIVAGAPKYLVPNGRLIVEIGPTQAAAVSTMMASQGFADITVTRDLDGRDRVVSARNPGE